MKNYLVVYNDTDIFLKFKDKYFKNESTALLFIEKLKAKKCEKFLLKNWNLTELTAG